MLSHQLREKDARDRLRKAEEQLADALGQPEDATPPGQSGLEEHPDDQEPAEQLPPSPARDRLAFPLWKVTHARLGDQRQYMLLMCGLAVLVGWLLS